MKTITLAIIVNINGSKCQDKISCLTCISRLPGTKIDEKAHEAKPRITTTIKSV